MPIYEATQNSDLTEGKGGMVTIAFFDNLEEAVKCVKGRGVMGVGDGEVYEIVIHSTVPDLNKYGRETKTKIYGYRRDLTGKWGDGYVDNRDQKEIRNDPEYQTYLRLKNKFG